MLVNCTKSTNSVDLEYQKSLYNSSVYQVGISERRYFQVCWNNCKLQGILQYRWVFDYTQERNIYYGSTKKILRRNNRNVTEKYWLYPSRPSPRWREKINFNFISTFLCSASKGFIKPLKAFIKPFEAPVRSMKIKI